MEIFKKHHQWNAVKKICTKLKENGYTAWLAGGCVRDGLLNVVPKDFDVATNATPEQVQGLFEKTVDVGKSFGVIRIVDSGGDIEVASFRKDGLYVDGRHPETVELSTPQEDAQRRDFTINALFFDPVENKIHDFVQGQEDLKSKIIKTVGTATHRFQEDKLRILRAVRFVSQLDFQLEKSTLEAVVQLAPQMTQVSVERITIELNKLLMGLRPDKGIQLLYETGLFKILFPEIKFEKNNTGLFKKWLGDPDQEILGWLTLFNNAEGVDKIAKRLRFSKDKNETVTKSLRMVSKFRNFQNLTLSEKRKLAASKEAPVAYKFLSGLEKTPDDLKSFLEKNPQLPAKFLTANDLMDAGIKPGKQMGELLEQVFEAQLEGKIKNRDEALKWIWSQIKS